MKSIFKIISQFFACALLSISAWAATTGDPYYPMAPGTSITYQVFEFTGTFDPNQLTLGITDSSRVAHANSPQTLSYSNTTCPLLYGSGPLYKTTYAPGTTSNTLRDGGAVTGNGVNYIGEAISQQNKLAEPFLPKLATGQRVAGQTISGVSTITVLKKGLCERDFIDADATPFYWAYKTIGWYAAWGAFNNAWRTGLLEDKARTDGRKAVYNYVFQKDVGMVNFWYGWWSPSDNSVIEGFEYYKIGSSP